ncbi:gdsl-like partial [Nannochloropsis oceanica]
MLGFRRQSKRDRGMSIRNLSHEGVEESRNLWHTGGAPARLGKTHKPVVLVMGDSHTQGMYGACYVKLLQAKFPKFHIVNGGRNGEVLESIRRRTGSYLKTYGGDIVGVIILGGTNDCLANLNSSTRTLIRLYNPFLKELPPLTEYTKTLHKLLAMIYSHSASSYIDICCVTPPIIAEFPSSPENVVVDSLCEAIRKTVRDFTHVKNENVRARGSSDSLEKSAGTTGRIHGVISISIEESVEVQDGKAHKQQQQKQQQQQSLQPTHSLINYSSHHRYCPSTSALFPSSSCFGNSKHPKPRLRRRLHCIDFNARMKRHLEEVLGHKTRKAFEPDFFNMCFNSGMSLLSGALVKWDTVSAARGLALHNDGVHLNERAIEPLVNSLSAWLEALQEEIYMQHTREAYASASSGEQLLSSLVSTLKFAEETIRGGEGREAAITAERGKNGSGIDIAERHGDILSMVDSDVEVMPENDTIEASKGVDMAGEASLVRPVMRRALA